MKCLLRHAPCTHCHLRYQVVILVGTTSYRPVPGVNVQTYRSESDATLDADRPVIHEWAMDYTMVDRSVRLTRIQTRGVLTVWTWPGDVDDAVLIVSELVTNAIRHAHVAGEFLRLRLAVLEDAALLIDVSDPLPVFGAAAGPVSPPPPAAEAEGKRGLRLVRCLGAKLSYFLRAEDGGKTVRARLEK